MNFLLMSVAILLQVFMRATKSSQFTRLMTSSCISCGRSVKERRCLWSSARTSKLLWQQSWHKSRWNANRQVHERCEVEWGLHHVSRVKLIVLCFCTLCYDTETNKRFSQGCSKLRTCCENIDGNITKSSRYSLKWFTSWSWSRTQARLALSIACENQLSLFETSSCLWRRLKNLARDSQDTLIPVILCLSDVLA